MPNLYDYFERACRRRTMEALRGRPGERIVNDDGDSAQFWLQVNHDRLGAVTYQCTTCFTLVALCEHLAGMAMDQTIEEAAAITPGQLLGLHRDIPEHRHDRATLAVKALQSAIEHSSQGACI